MGDSARFDDAVAAEIIYRQLLPFGPYPGALGTCTVYFGWTVSRPLAERATAFGDHRTAEELFREALLRDQALGALPDVALGRLALRPAAPPERGPGRAGRGGRPGSPGVDDGDRP